MDTQDIRAMMRTLRELRASVDTRKAESANSLRERFPRGLTETSPGNLFLSTSDGIVGEIVLARGGETGALSMEHVPVHVIQQILEMLEMGQYV